MKPRIGFRPTTSDDLPDLGRLWNDERVMHWVGFPEGLGLNHESIRERFDTMEADPNRHHFVAHSSEVGFCGELYYAVSPVRLGAAPGSTSSSCPKHKAQARQPKH
jgi:RimJ/RimL family protein N-acetyltransferase